MKKITLKLTRDEFLAFIEVLQTQVNTRTVKKDLIIRLILWEIFAVYKRILFKQATVKNWYSVTVSEPEAISILYYFNPLNIVDVLQRVTIKKICGTIHQKLI